MKKSLKTLILTTSRANSSLGSGHRQISNSSVLRQAEPSVAYYDEEQESMQKTVKSIIDNDINPYVDEWEASGQYPAKTVFKKLAAAGLLGVNKPVEYGGMGLNFKYSVALNEGLGHIRCGAIPMSIAVQTDMATPALARFGSEYVKREFLAPSISGEVKIFDRYKDTLQGTYAI